MLHIFVMFLIFQQICDKLISCQETVHCFKSFWISYTRGVIYSLCQRELNRGDILNPKTNRSVDIYAPTLQTKQNVEPTN